MDEEKTLLLEEDIVTDAPPADTQQDIEAPEDDAVADEMTELTTSPEGLSQDQTEPVTKKRRPSKKAILTAAISVAAVVAIAVSGILVYNNIQNNNAISAVETAINDIGDVEYTDECLNKLTLATNGYNELPEKLQEKVSNTSTLVSKREDYNNLRYDSMLKEACNRLSNAEFYAEYILSDVAKTWHNAIFENYDKYNKGNYDFNDAIAAYYADSDNKTSIDQFKSKTKANLDNLLTELQNPPDEYSNIYDAFIDAYSAFSSSYELSINPTGSYETYTDRISELSQSFSEKYSVLKAMYPDIADSPKTLMNNITSAINNSK